MKNIRFIEYLPVFYIKIYKKRILYTVYIVLNVRNFEKFADFIFADDQNLFTSAELIFLDLGKIRKKCSNARISSVNNFFL